MFDSVVLAESIVTSPWLSLLALLVYGWVLLTGHRWAAARHRRQQHAVADKHNRKWESACLQTLLADNKTLRQRLARERASRVELLSQINGLQRRLADAQGKWFTASTFARVRLRRQLREKPSIN